MRKSLAVAVAVALVSSLAACGRDDRQEKAGAAATDAKKDSPPAAVAGSDPASATAKGPLQTGETPAPGAVPDGTATGARSTPDPK